MTTAPAPTTWRPDRPGSLQCLQVVYKVAERCNINCSYCYYFNMGETTALDRPAKIDLEHAERFGAWVAQGCSSLDIPEVKIAFHGGEPMLLGPRLFVATCEALVRQISPVADLRFSIQTNGTILNDEWIEAFERFDIAVGISIDGDRKDHDRFRLDHQGRSTFDVTERNLRRLVELADGDPRRKPSTISVLDHRVDYLATYTYLREIGVEAMTFLLPDRTADDLIFRSGAEPQKIGARLTELFDAWMDEGDPSIVVRFINQALGHFRLGEEPGLRKRDRKSNQVIIARSDGTVSVDDSYIPALEWYSDTPVYDIATSSLQQFLADPIFLRIEELTATAPSACEPCPWVAMCRGGDLENRFSRRNGFDNPSVYCDSLKMFYQSVCEGLVDVGYPAQAIEDRFGGVLDAS